VSAQRIAEWMQHLGWDEALIATGKSAHRISTHVADTGACLQADLRAGY
jgi:hypothetical protein